MKSIRKFEPFSIALVPVDVVSPGGTFKCLAVGHPITVLDEVPSETENHGRTLVRVLSEHFPVGATYTQLKDKSGLQKTTFISGLNCATNEKKWIVGGRGQRCRYLLNPDGSWKAAVMAKEFQTQTGTEIQTGTGPQSTPYRGGGLGGPVVTGPNGLDPDQFRTSTSFEKENSEQPAKTETDPLSKASELVEKVGVKPPGRRNADAR
jgi:hypothetical protein